MVAFIGFQVEHEALIGRLLNYIALCQLPVTLPLPPEVHSRSRAPTRNGRVKTPNSGREREKTVEMGSENIGTILDEALRHMKIVQMFPGMSLTVN